MTRGCGPTGRPALAHARLSIIDLSPAGASADAERRRRRLADLQRRNLQFRGVPRASSPRSAIVFRSRTDSEVIANGWHAWGPTALCPAARHVRARLVGPARAPPDPRARPDRQEAALLRAGPPAGLCVRLRDQGVARLAGSWRAIPTSPRSTDYLTLQYVPAPDDRLCRHPPAAAGALSGGRGRCPTAVWREPELVRYWELPEPQHRAAPAAGRRAAARAGRPSRRGGAAAHDRRRAARRVSLGWGRFERGRRDDGAGRRWAGSRPSRSAFRRRNTTRPAMPAWSPSATAPSTRNSSSSPMRSRCCRASSGITASRLPTRRRSRPITSSQLARRHVTVALNGDGGDEAFLGYRRYRAMRYLDLLDRLAASGAGTGLARLLGTGARRDCSGGCGFRRSARC